MTLWDYCNGAAAIDAADVDTDENVFGRMLRRIRRRWRVMQARRELHSMSDEILRDLTLSRCQLDYIAEQFTRP